MSKYVLVLARHGEAGFGGGGDFERELTDRGVAQTAHVGKALCKIRFVPDKLISSSAVRTTKTTNILVAHMGIDSKIVEFRDDFYEPVAHHVLNEISKVNKEAKKLLIVGHNPAWSDMVNKLQNEFTPGLSTSCVAIIEFEMDSWADLKNTPGKLIYEGRFEE